jgi:hypothetical protein
MRPMLTTWLGLLSLGTGAALAYAQPEDWISLDRCAGCHQQGEKWNKKPNPKLDPLNKKKTTDFVLMNEYETWSQHDPHRNAAQALTNALGRRMGQLLQIKPEQHTACLSCHAVDTQPTKPFADKTADDYYSAEGNNCLSCHGKSRQWFEPHSLVSWRTKTPQEKSEKGLVDLRDAVVRAELCASCHVGNASEGKIVTHEMYAAGHPPLMPLEVISFCDHEPRHWRWPDEVPYFKADELTKEQLRDIYHYYPGTNDRTRQMVLSALTSFRVTMQMLQAEAQNGPLDLAHFDCYACHHDLKRPSWRQQRGYPGRPAGRPIIRPVSYELVRAVLAGSGGDIATLDAKMAALNRAYTTRAFGTPKEIAASAAELIAWTNEVVANLRQRPFDAQQSLAVARELTAGFRSAPKQPGVPLFDYDTSWQLTSALSVVLGDPFLKRGELATPAWQALDARLRLSLLPPKGQAYNYDQQLRARLALRNDFDPRSLSEYFEALGRSLDAVDPPRP